MISKKNNHKRASTPKLMGLGVLALLCVAIIGCSSSQVSKNATIFFVADYETDAVASSEDAADDPALWVNTADPANSIIIGTNKKQIAGGLELYTLKGIRVGGLKDPGLNNVDVKQGVKASNDHLMDLVAASRRIDGSLALYQFDGSSNSLINIEYEPRVLIGDVYGFCLYYDSAKNDLRAFVPTKSGELKHLKLEWQIDGKLKPIPQESISFSSQLEGCVTDEVNHKVFIGEEDLGLWSIDLNQIKAPPQLIDRVNEGHLVDDVEGVALVKYSDGTGYIMVSSQGENAFAIYNRQVPHQYQFSFQLVDSLNTKGNWIDGTYDTDGIEVYPGFLGDEFPKGIFIAQDGLNTDKDSTHKVLERNQNFKIIGLDKIFKK